MKEFIKKTFSKYGYPLSEKQAEQFDIYLNFLIEENKKYNLTAITEPNEIVIKHFIDSVLAEKEIGRNSSVIDVGTGAGFPGVPLKILRDDIKLTLLDSLQKRINFLNELIEKLGLKDVITVHARAEDYTLKNREKFDIATSRAVASLPTLSEYLIPYVKVGGKVLMYKGSKAMEEYDEGAYAVTALGGKLSEIKEFSLDEVKSVRYIIVIDKVKSTDKKYPRGKNLPKTKPLIKEKTNG